MTPSKHSFHLKSISAHAKFRTFRILAAPTTVLVVDDVTIVQQDALFACLCRLNIPSAAAKRISPGARVPGTRRGAREGTYGASVKMHQGHQY